MSRLSVIDLEGGQQPIFNKSRTKCIFFNGEIYNYKELKTALEAKGHSFSTRSDTEVLLHMYEQFGESMVSYLRGMFAFCICDETQRTIFIARDRFGEKPLFYHFDGSKITFSSEIASLLTSSDVPRRLNNKFLHYYLALTWIPEPNTLLKEVYSLPPGHSLTFDGTHVSVTPYFRVDYEPDEALKSEFEACEFLRPILKTAITRQTVSDVPVGAFLSGGIDSSTIAAFLQEDSTEKIKTFTVRFEDAEYDESAIAREVATRLGTDHHEIVMPNQGFDESLFWMILDHVGLPFADSSAIPTYLISREIRRHVTVALSGDGGDELFGGYTFFRHWQKIHAMSRIPALMRRGLLASSQKFEKLPFLRESNLLRQIERGLSVSQYSESEYGVHLSSLVNENELSRLLVAEEAERQSDFHLASQLPDEAAGWTGLRKAMYFRIVHSLPLKMLVKVDRMSMANSLEVRAPFLDPDLFAASTRLPDDLLIRDGNGKYIIREMMRGILPESVFSHPKTGFDIPLHNYLNKEFVALVDKLINKDNPLMELFDEQEVEKIKADGIAIKNNSAKVSVYRATNRLWMLMMLFGWIKRFDVAIEP